MDVIICARMHEFVLNLSLFQLPSWSILYVSKL